MLRILFILFIAFLLYTGFRFVLVMGRLVATIFAAMSAGRRVAQTARYQAEPVSQQNLVKCHGCHLYVLDQDAITVAGRQYCSFEHAKQAASV